MSDTLVGTEIKMAVSLSCDGITMDAMRFTCEFFTSPSRKIVLDKNTMLREDANTYIAVVDTAGMASGLLRMRAKVDVPDGDTPDGWRTESVIVETDTTIRRG